MAIVIGIVVSMIAASFVWRFGVKNNLEQRGLVLAIGVFACFSLIAATFLAASYPWRDNLQERYRDGYGVTQLPADLSP